MKKRPIITIEGERLFPHDIKPKILRRPVLTDPLRKVVRRAEEGELWWDYLECGHRLRFKGTADRRRCNECTKEKAVDQPDRQGARQDVPGCNECTKEKAVDQV